MMCDIRKHGSDELNASIDVLNLIESVEVWSQLRVSLCM